MKIEEVKTFIEQFAKAEAHAQDAYKKESSDANNKALDEMHQYTVASLKGQMGLIYSDKDEDADFL